MDEFSDTIGSLYLEAQKPVEDNGITRASASKSNPQHRERQATSFLDLPTELRDLIYQLALRRERRVRIGFRYDGDFGTIAESLRCPGRRKPPHRSVYHSSILRSHVGIVSRLSIKEQWPSLASASPLLKQEVLEMHYSQNVFDVHLRNFLDRRLCAQWIVERGSLLERVKGVRLQTPRSMPISFKLSLLADGSVDVGTSRPVLRTSGDCTCTFETWLEHFFASQGRHPEYAAARELGARPVLRLMIDICELAEWVERVWQVAHAPDSTHWLWLGWYEDHVGVAT
ncbi:hypothetical protein LTR53_015184 [Teratosphaeriaceae sp. CCFEE 6253]|nr:hypothetical protein LTR53_015184 [Teratosphaeriaceae sp. CCFEE 6253]